MSFFSEERQSELKELFFESASELLQTLNEEGKTDHLLTELAEAGINMEAGV